MDPGELIRGLVDVRTRLDKIKRGKEGRARLVGAVLEGDEVQKQTEDKQAEDDNAKADATVPVKTEMQTMVDIDRRVGELENLVGSSSTALDEVSHTFLYSIVKLTRRTRHLLYLHHFSH